MHGMRIDLRPVVATVAAVLLGGALPRVVPAQIYWTDWTSATVSNTGSASGLITTPSGPVTASYTGQVYATTQTACGASYWVPTTPYLSPTVPNAPPPCDIVTLTGGPTFPANTITFSQPILNPVMAILSLGQPGVTVTYNFDSPFNILSFGPGYFGGPGTLQQLTPNVLTGVEGHGVIQFQGTFSSISWTVPTPETWHGFTLGIVGVAPPSTTVPEPATIGLVALGLGGLAVGRRMHHGRRA